ncbi:MAG: D-alanine--D-alanine ligase [Deltaproteobacteria bacterium]|nr:D-alanine--D-alanine ligase [Deltaproteobacteria bacterium]MCB9478738.1 D-alanine--D-alanine ligase [Deltaproteobacteria bacterium]MCB9488254.1 D-alanine--D-alanine ligase [Deltaproteobacteria bacterium]
MTWIDKRVAVLLGGPSSEREVSLRSGAACAEALRRRGYDVTEIDAGPDLAERLRAEKIDVAFIALHGKWGEDGCVQGLLEMMRIPYTGAGVTGSAVAMDKVLTKVLLKHAGVPTPDFTLVERMGRDQTNLIAFPLPWVIKPATDGSSVGVTIVTDGHRVDDALDLAFETDARVLIERYVKGREMSVGVLSGRALGVVEVRPKPVEGEAITFYDYKHKYTKGMTDYIAEPSDLPAEARDLMMALSTHACETLQVSGQARVDYMLDEDGGVFVLEVNTIPGMTELSLLPMTAHHGAGWNFDELVERILHDARLHVGS